jgi:hypothetical protein
MEKIQALAECDDCGGTGVYVGFAEKTGAGMECHTCGGTGCHKIEIEYTPFTKRKLVKGIKRVFARACGYFHAAETHTGTDGKTVEFSKAGATYKEWLEGKKPLPVKDLYCPYMWTSQECQCDDHPKYSWFKKHCSKHNNCCNTITDCPMYGSKHKCWETYGED